MFDILLHAGTEHPNLSFIVVASLLSFLAGLGIGTYSEQLAGLFTSTDSEPTE
ncbi:uncharacterized protein NP_2006A [Natronomonas pharaonis DSM 2160]|uniref:Uncharacterized protein n=1 Tax=Natronomonas pharaonis (strain ATCC 35678 / DSM 2160 / CIP 103997 / JCM 8858 / NBRC 14720 / NCIMB 2260 / Gabara) TaxID=348780 RepID=A0A1U7EVM8_NATPD|nr:hypothetical protein [Natronomonas pharaonis]CAI49094.2 uncharacterized protein NP_2006A [Natronomonas pharaonis DSM 2160]